MRIIDIQIHQAIGLLRILTDTGMEGWCPGLSPDTGTMIHAHYKAAVIGQDPIDRERIWVDLRDIDQAHHVTLRGYLDTALWDLTAKSLGLPVYRMIGGFRDRVPTYFRGSCHNTVDGIVQEAAQAQADGFLGYKLRPPFTGDQALEVIRKTREVVGPDFYLIMDGMHQFYVDEAVKVGYALDECDYYWFEDPVQPGNLKGSQQVASEIDTPITIGLNNLYDTSQILSDQSADMVRAATPLNGGITDQIKIARTADAFGVFCHLASPGLANGFVHAHILGATKNAPFFEYAGPLDQNAMITNPLTLKDGYLHVPQSPGLGLELNWALVEQQTEEVIS